MRTLAAAVLAFQSLVIALAIPVAITVYGVDGTRAGWIGGALVVSCLVVAGLLRYRWAYALGWVIQALTILAGFVVPVMFVLGVVFALLWWGALRLGAKGDAAQAAFRAQAAEAAAAEQGDAPQAPPERLDRPDAADDADDSETGGAQA